MMPRDGRNARDERSSDRAVPGLRAVAADALSREEAELELAALAEDIGAHDLLYYQVPVAVVCWSSRVNV